MNNLPIVAGVIVTTDKDGRFNLNALHKASGLNLNKAPSQWLVNKGTQELVNELVKNKTMENPIVSTEGRNGGTFAHELLAVSYAGWISPEFQLKVNQVFLDYKNGKLEERKDTGLPQFRKARAIKSATDSAKEICATFPSLSECSKQAIYASLINPIAGLQVIPPPAIEQELYEAGKVGERLNISANMVGRIANALGIKTDEYGKTVLGQSKYSRKQVSTFLYNEKGIEAIKNALEEITETTH